MNHKFAPQASRGRFLIVTLGLLFLASSVILLDPHVFAGRSTVPARAATVAPPELVLQTGHTMKVNCVVFGPDGNWVASGGADNSIKIWDVNSGRELRALSGHTGWINALAVSTDGRLLASGSNDRTVRLWDVVSGQQLRIFP